jgi:hypothetical protein
MIRARKQRTDVGPYYFINRAIRDWDQLPADLLATYHCNLKLFRKRVKNIISNGVLRGLDRQMLGC